MTYAKRIVIASLLMVALSPPVLAQQPQKQPSLIEQFDIALSRERLTSNEALALKDMRINELKNELEAVKKEAAACKPEAKKDDKK